MTEEYSKTCGAEKQHVKFTENGTAVDDYRDYSEGYVSDIVNGKKTYYCNYAEQNYALQNMTGLELPTNNIGIVWMLDPYNATSMSQLDFNDSSLKRWEQANAFCSQAVFNKKLVNVNIKYDIIIK